MSTFEQIEAGLDAPVAEVIRRQGPVHQLGRDPVDDRTLLTLLDLAGHATASAHRRCEFVVVRDPDVKHQLARINRQGWAVYKRVLRSRMQDDSVLAARQWQADHLEDLPVLVVACVVGRRPIFPAIGASTFFGSAFPAVQNLLLGATAAGLGATATTLPLWSQWEARRTLGLPGRVTPVSVVALGWPRGNPTPLRTPPVGNITHLDRWGHQPFRAHQG